MALRFKTTDPRGMTVICADEAWQHIITRRHFADLSEIQAAIEHPLSIHKDSDHNHKQIYYGEGVRKNEYIKVVTQFRGQSTLVIVTAYHTSNTKPGEEEIWRR